MKHVLWGGAEFCGTSRGGDRVRKFPPSCEARWKSGKKINHAGQWRRLYPSAPPHPIVIPTNNSFLLLDTNQFYNYLTKEKR